MAAAKKRVTAVKKRKKVEIVIPSFTFSIDQEALEGDLTDFVYDNVLPRLEQDKALKNSIYKQLQKFVVEMNMDKTLRSVVEEYIMRRFT